MPVGRWPSDCIRANYETRGLVSESSHEKTEEKPQRQIVAKGGVVCPVMPGKKPKSPKKPRSPKRGKKASAGSDVGTCVEEGCTAMTVCDVVLQAALEITSVDVAEVPADTVVFVLETQPIDGGGQRALVALGDPARGHAGGWVTSISPGGKYYLRNGECFVRPNPVLESAVPSGEEHEEEVPFSA